MLSKKSDSICSFNLAEGVCGALAPCIKLLMFYMLSPCTGALLYLYKH